MDGVEEGSDDREGRRGRRGWANSHKFSDDLVLVLQMVSHVAGLTPALHLDARLAVDDLADVVALILCIAFDEVLPDTTWIRRKTGHEEGDEKRRRT
jgi:hypothetical protein